MSLHLNKNTRWKISSMSRLCIHHASGSGGQFLTTIIAKILDLQITNRIDSTHGDYHRSNKGVWAAHSDIKDDVCFMGNYWINQSVPAKIYYTHQHDFVSKLQTMFNCITVIAIDADEDDFEHITTLLIKKAFPNLWTHQEYNKWVELGCNFPPYSIDNLKDLAVFDIIHEQLNNDTIEWHQQLKDHKIDYTIKFKTIFGLDNLSLKDSLETILNKPVTDSIKQLIVEYQLLNKELYFNA